jgi:hypothetical protein
MKHKFERTDQMYEANLRNWLDNVKPETDYERELVSNAQRALMRLEVRNGAQSQQS